MFKGVVAVAGSRSVSGAGACLVGKVAGHLVGSGCSLALGCCVGVDAVALVAVPVGSVQVLAAFGPGGAGSCPWSAVGPVMAFSRAGGAVQWWAGGGAGVPLSVRLRRRTQAVARAGQGGLVAFLSSPGSRGTLLACRQATRLGRPVVVFPLGFSGGALPLLGAGHWVQVSAAGVWSTAWCWQPAQVSLF